MRSNAPARPSGRHFLQIPGPTNVPDRILQAIAMPVIDHRGPEFAEMAKDVIAGMKRVFQTQEMVVIYPSSGTGAWEAALSNTLSPGDRVLMFETGHFASLWRAMAGRLGLEIDFVPGDWRHGVDPAQVEEKLAADRAHQIKAVCVVHNETSTGVTSRIPEDPRRNRSRASSRLVHGRYDLFARLDRLSSRRVEGRCHGRRLAEGIDVAAGLGFNAVSKKALAAAEACQAGALLLGLAGDGRGGGDRLFPLYASHQPVVRAASRHCRCCSMKRGSTPSFAAMRAMPRRRAARSPAGVSRCCAPIRASIRTR